MKKKELLKHVPQRVFKNTRAKVVEAKGEKTLMLLIPDEYSDGRGIVHFVTEKDYATYYPTIGIWTNESLSNWNHSRKIDKNSRDEIASFTGGNGSIYEVLNCESNIRWERAEQRDRRKQDRIDELMKSVPALPKDFRRRVLALGGNNYAVKLFQPWGDIVVERIFKVEGHLIGEACRAFTHGYGASWDGWYYGTYKHEIGIHQRFWDKKPCHIANLPKKHYVYDNLDDLDMTPAQRSVLREMSGLADPSLVLKALYDHEGYEVLVKNGMKRLAAEITEDRYIASSAIRTVAGMPKGQRKRIAELDIGVQGLKMLSEHPEITDKNLEDFAKIKSKYKAAQLHDLTRKFNINHVMNLLRQTGGIKQNVIKKYEDYLSMAERLGHNPADEIIYRNKKWHEWHDRYVEELNKKRDQAENEKYKNISKDYKKNTKLFSWSDDKYEIVVPKDALAINTEGKLQHHCVGSSSIYKQNMNDRKAWIVFLRKKEDPDKPYYTVECDRSRVIQFYAAYDRQPDKEQVSKVLATWMKQVRKNFKEVS